jgi:integrase
LAEGKKRRRNRIPGVFKRGDKWYFKVSFQDSSGRYRQLWRGGYDTQDEADEARTEAKQRRNQGIDISPQRVTVEEFLRRWLRDYASLKRRSTYEGYRGLLETHVIPAIGALRLSRLLPLHVQGVYAEMRRKGDSEKTVLNCHRVLSEALKHAVDWEVALRNPAEKVRPPAPPDYRPEILSIDDVRALLGLLDDGPRHTFLRFALYSGMRQGEQLRLRWGQVDFARGLVSIDVAKSKAGVRGLELSPDAVELLRQHRYRQLAERQAAAGAYRDQGYVFAQPDGAPLTASMVSWEWKKLRKVLGTKARPHDLRHTNASLLLKAGVPMKVVQERLGHASYQITADIYTHLTPGLGLSEQAGAKLDALLRAEAEEGRRSNLVADENNRSVN